jgi:hypothetical protein
MDPLMLPTPRVLLSIDYEPWFALSRRYDHLQDSFQRRDLDGKFTLQALEPILEMLGGSKISFYLVGEIAEWYPQVPQQIVRAGHELGLHCQIHRPLINIDEVAADIRATQALRNNYRVRGYRAPMIGASESVYGLLEEARFEYSSSIYAPAGTFLPKGHIWEIPVSTLRLWSREKNYAAPRQFTTALLLSGEFPYGSSFSIGLMGTTVLRIIESELKKGLSPVIFLHPYELIRPDHWGSRIWRDVVSNTLLLPFTWSKVGFLSALLHDFPVSPIGDYLDEALKIRGSA